MHASRGGHKAAVEALLGTNKVQVDKRDLVHYTRQNYSIFVADHIKLTLQCTRTVYSYTVQYILLYILMRGIRTYYKQKHKHCETQNQQENTYASIHHMNDASVLYTTFFQCEGLYS